MAAKRSSVAARLSTSPAQKVSPVSPSRISSGRPPNSGGYDRAAQSISLKHADRRILEPERGEHQCARRTDEFAEFGAPEHSQKADVGAQSIRQYSHLHFLRPLAGDQERLTRKGRGADKDSQSLLSTQTSGENKSLADRFNRRRFAFTKFGM